MSVCLQTYIISTTYMPGAHKGHKRVSNALELELQGDVSSHVGAGKQILVL